MDKFIFTLIVTFSTTSYAVVRGESQIQIFEIRKAREDIDRGNEFQIDTEYYDPDGLELMNKIEHVHRANNPSKYKNRNVDEITENLINKLRKIVQSNNRFIDRKDNDDYIFKYKDLKHDNEFENNLKTPIVLVAHKDVLYHVIPQHQRIKRNKLQTGLRSFDSDEEIENRTAPPRTNIRYDYEYD